MKIINSRAQRFFEEESGLALTEYLILLGLLVSVVLGAVLLFGTSAGALWNEWAVWIGDNLTSPG